jgi:hypothetical protein
MVISKFAKIGELPPTNGKKHSGRTINDARRIGSPSPSENFFKAWGSQMQQTRKGNRWHLGMKLRIRANSKPNLIHCVSTTVDNVHNKKEVSNLLCGKETPLYCDSAYRAKTQREWLKQIALRAKDFINKLTSKNLPQTDADKATRRRKPYIQAKVEHPFLIINRPRVLSRGAITDWLKCQSGLCDASCSTFSNGDCYSPHQRLQRSVKT